MGLLLGPTRQPGPANRSEESKTQLPNMNFNVCSNAWGSRCRRVLDLVRDLARGNALVEPHLERNGVKGRPVPR